MNYILYIKADGYLFNCFEFTDPPKSYKVYIGLASNFLNDEKIKIMLHF